MLHRGSDEPARAFGVAPVERGTAGVQQFIALALPLGDRAAGPLDVGAGTGMAAVDEEHARPDVDREFVLFGKIMIEPREQELFDARVSVPFRHVCRKGQTVRTERVGHVSVNYSLAMAIIESIPNVSEGRRPEIVARMADAITQHARGAAARRLIRCVAQPFGLHDRR